MTCFPVGSAAIRAVSEQRSGSSRFVIGGLAAVAAAVYMTYYLLTWKGRQRRFAGKP